MRVEEPEAANLQTSQDGITSNQIAFATHKDVDYKLRQAVRTRGCAKNRIIGFRDARRVLSWWHVNKERFNELLYEWEQAGYIKIVPYKGLIFEEEVQP